ncbi:MAG: tRNA lysidine(34) synthetase TilS [Spirochaetia bacterium]
MSSIAETLLTTIQSSACKAGVRKDDSLCIAYSGGPDSTALLALMVRLRELKEYHGLQLRAVYIDHGLRGRQERSRELALVQTTCTRFGVPLYIKFFPSGYLLQHDSYQLGTEAVAREFRYRYLHKVRTGGLARRIVLGHTRDDQVETVLMRCFQGSGPEGLQGIAESEGPLWRPLLEVSKAQLLEYLRGNRLDYSLDTSNTDAAFTRNRIRHTLLPQIRAAFPGVETSLLHLSDKMRAVETVLEESEREIPEIEAENGTAEYKWARFMRLPLYIRVRMLYRLYNRWYPESPRRLPYRFVRQLCTCSISNTHGCCGEGYGIRMEKRGTSLFWERTVVPNRKNSYLIVVQAGSVHIGNRWRLRFSSSGLDSTPPFSCNTMEFTAKEPCVIRTRREGDVIYLYGGRKKLKEALREIGVEQTARAEIAVLEDRRGILALIPLDSPDKIRWSRFAKSINEADAQYEIMELESERR